MGQKSMMALRWGDNDHYFGPFTYARDRRYKPLAIELSSADDEDRKCNLRISGFGHTLIARLPPIVWPYREKVFPQSWDAATVERLGRNWYWQVDERQFGFTYSGGHLSLHFGRQTNDSLTTRQHGWFLPWTQWRHVRISFYGLSGEHFRTILDAPTPSLGGAGRKSYDDQRAAEKACPSRTFAFSDFDGEKLTAKTLIEEREWRFGTGWFKWLAAFRKPKISRCLDITFSGETGERKGSWKGGTIGHSIEMLPGELHEGAFRRYCAEHSMTFGEAA